MKDELKYIFGNVNEWLKFAEAKHAGLIVLNSAIIIGLLSSPKFPFDKWTTIISFATFGLSVLASLISQFPVTSNFLIRFENITNPNIYFFGDLAKIKMQDFISEFKNSFPNFNADLSDKNLINQILINSKITSSKYKVFKFCCWLTVFGIGFLGFSSILNYFLCH